ncbi:MAG TPA: DUF4179 domain-containing protein [Anaerolineales bacterium]|nr:DUF4179 domain-containing protein [Anaerolineales bacterium]HLO28492.1 DUF4179 domain-containing protein [Anaerolineales bacterium]
MNRKPYRDILDSAAADSLSRNTNLWPKISARLERHPLMTTLRTRPIMALLIALFILLALSGVVYALGRAFGYIPGVGLVDQSAPIRVLAEPVTVKQQGISVTVSKVVADSTRTFLSYRVDGIPLVENQIPACITMPELHLPDGSKLENNTGSGGVPVLRNGASMYYAAEGIYGPIPAGGNQAILVLSCVLPEGGSSEFKLPLNLVPAPAGYATPAVELAVTVDGGENKTGLHLEKVLELADSYILIGKFTDAGDLPGPLYMTTSSDSDYLPHIEDANRNPVSLKVREDVRPDPDWDVAYYWAYEIQKPVAAPLKITVDQVNIRKHSMAQIQFEAGDHPQVGQEWNLNQLVKLGAYTFTLDKITFIGNGYVLHLSYENLPQSVSFFVNLVDNPSNPFQFDNSDERENHVGTKVLHTITLTTKSPPPIGNLTVEWQLDESIPQPGPWSLVWTPSTTRP